MRNLVNQAASSSANQLDSSISRVISYYSIEKIASPLSQIGSSERNILADTPPLTDLEVLHRRKEIESNLGNISFSDKDNFIEDKGILESRAERKVNSSIYQDQAKSLSLLNQYQASKDSRPERENVNLLQIINSTNTQLTLLRNGSSLTDSNSVRGTNPSLTINSFSSILTSDIGINSPINQVQGSKNLQSFQLEKIALDKPENQHNNFSILKERSSFVSEIQTVRPQIADKNTKSPGFNRSSATSSRPEKFTVLNQDRQTNIRDSNTARERALKVNTLNSESQEIRKQKLIDDFVNQPYSHRELSTANEFYNRISKEFRSDDQQHIIAAEAFAKRYGIGITRTIGIVKEAVPLGLGIVLHELQGNLDEYIASNRAPEIIDIIQNEMGLIKAGGSTRHLAALLGLIQAFPLLSRIYEAEIKRHAKMQTPDYLNRYSLGVSKSLREPSERYSLGISSPAATPTSRYSLGVKVPSLSQQQPNKVSGQGNTNTSGKEGINRSDGRDRSQGAGGRDPGQRERNRESGHKGYGGPQ
jgi:hypothetical protein